MPDSPNREAPAATIACAASQSRMPPDAFTPSRSPTVARIRATACVDAPPAGWKPVEVFTKSAPAASAAWQAATISSSVSAADSMMTLSTAGAGMASRTAAISAWVWAASPAFRAPMSMTMSTSSAPCRTDSAASNAFAAGVCLPEGNPATVATFTLGVNGSGSIEGDTQIEYVPSSAASRANSATSAMLAVGASRV